MHIDSVTIVTTRWGSLRLAPIKILQTLPSLQYGDEKEKILLEFSSVQYFQQLFIGFLESNLSHIRKGIL